MITHRRLLFAVLCVAFITSTAFAGDDPPARVARLDYISGEVSIQPGGVNEWVAGSINRPLTSTDRVWTARDARAELQLGGASVQLNSEASLTLVNVNDNNVQLQLDQGTLNLHVSRLFDGEIYEVDTPNTSFIVQKSGDYRFDVDNEGDTTAVTVWKGKGQATGDGPAIQVGSNQQYTFRDGRSLQHISTNAPGYDGFDDWCRVRGQQQDKSASLNYVSPYTVGYSDLDTYGRWVTADPYGPIWVPASVGPGWAPYRYGHWVWVGPWGWTWVDDAPWGFAPYHYGRWIRYDGNWGWCPGPIRVRPIYAPALVAWVGGPNFGVGLSFGIGGGVGWFPLGWGEPYIPYYRHSRGYFQNVNVSNTRITNITYVTNNYYNNNRVTNIRYANRTIPNAVTAVSNDNFRLSKPTREGFVRVSPHDVERASIERDIHVRPTTNSVLGANPRDRHAEPPHSFSRPARMTEPDRGVEARGPERGMPGDRAQRTIPPPQSGMNTNGEVARPNRSVPRPPDRGRSVTTAEEQSPHGVPNPPNRMNRSGGSDAVNSMPSRVPHPPQGGVQPGQNNDRTYTGRPSRDVTAPASDTARPSRSASPSITSPVNERHSVPRPPEGQVVRPERRSDNPGGNERQPAPRVQEDRANPRSETPPMRQSQSRNEGVTRDVRPSAPSAPPARQAEPARQAQPSRENSRPETSRPSRQEKQVEKDNGGPRSGLRYPSSYSGSVQSASQSNRSVPHPSYTAPATRSYASSSYRPSTNYSSPRSSSVSYTPRSYSARSAPSFHETHYSQPASRNEARSSGSGGSSGHRGSAGR